MEVSIWFLKIATNTLVMFTMIDRPGRTAAKHHRGSRPVNLWRYPEGEGVRMRPFVQYVTARIKPDSEETLISLRCPQRWRPWSKTVVSVDPDKHKLCQTLSDRTMQNISFGQNSTRCFTTARTLNRTAKKEPKTQNSSLTEVRV